MSQLIIKALRQYHPVIEIIRESGINVAEIPIMPPIDTYEQPNFHYWKTNKPILLLKKLESNFKQFIKDPITLSDVVADSLKRRLDALSEVIAADRKEINSMLAILNGSVSEKDLKRDGNVKQASLSLVSATSKRSRKRKTGSIASAA